MKAAESARHSIAMQRRMTQDMRCYTAVKSRNALAKCSITRHDGLDKS